MDNIQFQQMMGKLEEIRCGIVAIEASVDTDKNISSGQSNMLAKFRDSFFEGLEFKTGWGRNEIKRLFEEVLEDL